MSIEWHTAPEDQGQIMQVSYACLPGRIIREIHDQSDGSTTYAALEIDEDDDWYDETFAIANGAPPVGPERWQRISTAAVHPQIETAAASIGATPDGPGTWTYYAEETSEIWRVTDADLLDLAGLMSDPDPRIARDAYSHWCAGSPGQIVQETNDDDR